MINENLLQFAWKFRLYNNQNIKLLTGETLEVLSPGYHNKDAGPDFQDARLKIGGVHWAGNVEVHIRSSDWFRHNHPEDEAYSNIILHVVNENDSEVKDRNGIPVPVLELKSILPGDLLNRWEVLNQRRNPIPCSEMERPDSFTLQNWLDRLLIERLEEKLNRINTILRLTSNDWQEAFYVFLARSFGFKINAVPFELLARSVPLKTVIKHEQSSFQLEALFFGQSGLLNQNLTDAYPVKLWEEYNFLQRKFNLIPIEPHLWKFLRLRPGNFPGIRIAQFADIMSKASSLFLNLIETTQVDQLRKVLAVSATGYWETHYLFDAASAGKKKHIGEAAIEGLLINTIVPFLFIYGTYRGDEPMKARSLQLLEQLKPEKNALLTDWNSMGIQAQTAGESQALLQLRTEYCNKNRCLECALGHRILKKK